MQPSDAPGANAAHPNSTLTSAQFHILLTLVEGRRHGYGIMQEIERRTDGAVELGPGTLYRSIKQLLARGFIVEVDSGADGLANASRPRRSYALTPGGRACAAEEAQRLQALVRWVEDSMVIEGGQP